MDIANEYENEEYLKRLKKLKKRRHAEFNVKKSFWFTNQGYLIITLGSVLIAGGLTASVLVFINLLLKTG